MKLPINLGSVPDMNLPDPGGGQGKPQQNQLVSALGFCQLVVNRKNGALQGKGVKGLLAQPWKKFRNGFSKRGGDRKSEALRRLPPKLHGKS